MSRHIVIIGGGISGLSAAYYLSRFARQEKSSVQIKVLEANHRFGGVVRTLSCGHTLIEAGADAFYGSGEGGEVALALCRELGIQGELLEANPCFRRFFILKGQKIFSIPENLSSFSALSIKEIFRLPLLSPAAKCRMALEPWIPCRKENSDESVGYFFRRRLGTGFFHEVIRPLIRGVYMADPETLSVQEVFPGFKKAERTCGSLGKAFWREKNKCLQRNRFFTFRGGLETFIHGLVRQLEDCELRTHSKVQSCEYDAGWKVILEHGEMLPADDVCLAMTASDASKLIKGSMPELFRELSGISYGTIVAVNVIFKTEDILHPNLDFGFIVPADDRKNIFSSLKWLGKTPDGQHLYLRAFIHGENAEVKDDLLLPKVMEDLRKIFGIMARPCFMSVERYPDVLPQYQVGHAGRMATLQEKLKLFPGLYLTGNSFYGFGISDCIFQAKEIACKISAHLYIEK
ncbi:MAG TPA: protoporphyrinogen oxidase [Candidatus Omnitrophota bacterium]|nr:protoporphyrinogen oxidase [Candidatus Omnitrophota bacterium]